MFWRTLSRMANSAQLVAGPSKAAPWPLAYHIPPVIPKTSSLQSYGFKTDRPLPPKWWSHTLYRGPGGKEVEILYSKTKAESEVIAQHFLKEPILGFDMEWPWNDWELDDSLQNKVGLIQIASEDKIALFHTGLHSGKTSEDIIAPTLRKIIEDPTIGKIGVNILGADFARLSRFFGLEPKGAVESSHLYRLVKFGPKAPELVSVKMVALAKQVEDQLGLPLFKGDVRTSNWSKPLSKKQITYAAGDAYAGFMLYKCMNAKRLAMKPTPPLPIHADKYPKGKTSKDSSILLDVGDGTIMTTAAFFGVEPVTTVSKAVTTGSKAVVQTVPGQKGLDPTSQALYNELVARRALIAGSAGRPAWRIISDTLLQAIARQRPQDAEGLLVIKGIGKIQQQRYGAAWIDVVSSFMTGNRPEQPAEPESEKGTSAAKSEPLKDADAVRNVISKSAKDTDVVRKVEPRTQQTTPDSWPAFETPPSPTLQRHSRRSFSMAETKLDGIDDARQNNDSPSYDSDSSIPSLNFGSPSGSPNRRVSSGTKRRRPDNSPTKTSNKVKTSLNNPKDIMADEPAFLLSQLMAHAADVAPSHAPSKHTISKAPPKHTPSRAPQKHTPSRAPPKPTSSKAPQNHTSPKAPPQSRIARNKLLAFSKLVASKLPDRPADAPGLVYAQTLDRVVAARPQTQAELERLPGLGKLLWACEKTGMDLLRNVVKFVGTREEEEEEVDEMR